MNGNSMAVGHGADNCQMTMYNRAYKYFLRKNNWYGIQSKKIGSLNV